MSELRIHIRRRVPKPEKRPTRLSAFLLWAIAIAGLIAISPLGALLAPVIDKFNPHLQFLLVNLLYYLPFVALPAFLLARRTPGLYEAYRPNPISLFDTISIVILAVLGVFFVNDITVLWAIPFQKLGMNIYTTSLPAASTTGELMLSVITVAVLPGVCEEFLLRGVVLSAFEEEGTKRAMWISALLFMLMHGSMIGAPTQLILGLVLGFLVFWTNSIYAGLIYHTVHNASAVMLDFVQSHSVDPSAAPATGDLLQDIGGAAGVISLALGIVIIGAMISFSLKLFRLRGQLKGVTAETGTKKRLHAKEWALFIIGILLCIMLYILQIDAMLGG